MNKTVTWQDITMIIAAHSGVPAWRSGSTRGWYIASPAGGTFSVEVELGRRSCAIAIDRWRTTDRDEAKSEPWFKEHIWPHVSEALETGRGRTWGTLPSGHTFSSACPLDRAVVPELLAAWIDAELTWGIAADDQWPHFAPHKVIPGPLGNFGGRQA